MAVIWSMSCKNASFELEAPINVFFLNCYYIRFQDMQSFFECLIILIGCIYLVIVLNDFVSK